MVCLGQYFIMNCSKIGLSYDASTLQRIKLSCKWKLPEFCMSLQAGCDLLFPPKLHVSSGLIIRYHRHQRHVGKARRTCRLETSNALGNGTVYEKAFKVYHFVTGYMLLFSSLL